MLSRWNATSADGEGVVGVSAGQRLVPERVWDGAGLAGLPVVGGDEVVEWAVAAGAVRQQDSPKCRDPPCSLGRGPGGGDGLCDLLLAGLQVRPVAQQRIDGQRAQVGAGNRTGHSHPGPVDRRLHHRMQQWVGVPGVVVLRQQRGRAGELFGQAGGGQIGGRVGGARSGLFAGVVAGGAEFERGVTSVVEQPAGVACQLPVRR